MIITNKSLLYHWLVMHVCTCTLHTDDTAGWCCLQQWSGYRWGSTWSANRRSSLSSGNEGVLLTDSAILCAKSDVLAP